METPSRIAMTAVSPTTIVFNQPQFLTAVRSVLLDRGQMMIGRVRRRRTTHQRELIVDRWSPADGMPDGRSMAPMLDWAVMVTNFEDAAPVDRLVEIVQPRKSQLLIAVSLDPQDHNVLPVLISDEGRLIRPDQVRFIGSGLLTLPDPRTSLRAEGDAPNTDESGESDFVLTTDRASRTAGALGELHDRLRTMLVVLIGAGRGSQELARQLVAAGLRRLIVIDDDTIGEENLDAMPMATIKDIGQNKAVHLARALRRNQPELTVSCVPYSVTAPEALRVLRETRADTVFSFIDNNVGRLAVSRLCQETETVHVDVGTLIERTDGGRHVSADVRLLEPRQGCMACAPQMEDLDDVLYELAAPEGSLHRGRRMDWHELRSGSLLHINALACGLAVETWLRWLEGRITTSHWLRLRWPPNSSPEIHEAPVGPSDDCLFCHPEN